MGDPVNQRVKRGPQIVPAAVKSGTNDQRIAVGVRFVPGIPGQLPGPRWQNLTESCRGWKMSIGKSNLPVVWPVNGL